MKRSVPFLIGSILSTTLAFATDNFTSAQLTVRTSTGSFTGLIDAEYPNTLQWRAVPFAQPPVASRRWLPPQELESSPDEHHYSTKFPPSCPQFFSAVESMWNLPITRGGLVYNGAQNDSSGMSGEATSEDCLYLAVWAPKTPPPEDGFPVLFFVTGGGLAAGGVELPWQIPSPWVERAQSAIIVSINYRLSIFGFPNARGLVDGEQNLGILDQRMALEWVRDNVAAFGGNPDRITHWGRSAGSICTDAQAYAWYDDPIAQAYFLESGTVFSYSMIDDPNHSNFTFVAKNVGCDAPCGVECEDENEEGAAELDCMRQVSATQIVNFVGKYIDSAKTPPIEFTYVPDDQVIFRDYQARSEAGKLASRPVLASFTANEFAGLAPWPKDNLTDGPWQPFITEATVAFGVCPSFNSTVYRNRLSEETPVFRFQYAGVFPNLNVYEWMGAYHNSETPLIFGTYDLLDHVAETTDFQVEVSETMQDHIMAFAQDPYHGPQKAFGWEPQVASDPRGGSMIRFGADGKTVQHLDGVEVDAVCLGLGEYDPFP